MSARAGVALGLALSALSGAHACTPRPTQRASLDPRHTQSSGGSPTQSGSVASESNDGALAALRTALLRGEVSALRDAGVELGRGGATEINGDRAVDETVAAVEIAVRDSVSALVVVRTSCGNVRVVGYVREGAAWRARAARALVPSAVPGSCVRVALVAQSIALRGDPPREAALGVRWEDAMADEIHGPNLWVFGLDPAQGFTVLLERAPFGGTDDRTGSSTEGSLAVLDELPPPRPLFVEIRPGQRGMAPSGGLTRTVRRYELRGARIELVDEQRSSVTEDSTAARSER